MDRQLITDKGATSNVYQVSVPEEFVAGDVKAKVTDLRRTYPGFEELGKCCNFAVKVFEAENRNIFQNEVAVYKMMRANSGMLTYLSDFTLNNGNETTHAIILEYAHSDLSDYFYRTSPALPEQIFKFWKEMSGIAVALKDMHKFTIDNFNHVHVYEGWHADVKSDNILLVNRQFELADPGLARFQRCKGNPGSHRALSQFTGATTSYSAPERRPFAFGPPNLRASDVWSLGCVLSESVTWVVLGSSGVGQFRDLRLNAIRHQFKNCNPQISSNRGVQYDSFHTGEQVLSEVKEWHEFLRQARRRNDILTDRILDLVDQHLLIAEPNARFTAARICEWFEAQLDEVDCATNNESGTMSEAVRKAISIGLEQEAEELLRVV